MLNAVKSETEYNAQHPIGQQLYAKLERALENHLDTNNFQLLK